jgi:hypothetical protein
MADGDVGRWVRVQWRFRAKAFRQPAIGLDHLSMIMRRDYLLNFPTGK